MILSATADGLDRPGIDSQVLTVHHLFHAHALYQFPQACSSHQVMLEAAPDAAASMTAGPSSEHVPVTAPFCPITGRICSDFQAAAASSEHPVSRCISSSEQ